VAILGSDVAPTKLVGATLPPNRIASARQSLGALRAAAGGRRESRSGKGQVFEWLSQTCLPLWHEPNPIKPTGRVRHCTKVEIIGRSVAHAGNDDIGTEIGVTARGA